MKKKNISIVKQPAEIQIPLHIALSLFPPEELAMLHNYIAACERWQTKEQERVATLKCEGV